MDDSFDHKVTNCVRAIGLLTRRVRAAVASHDLTWTQTMVMARLDKEGSFTSADLARAEGMKPQSMGTTIAELLEMGLVERKPHPTDGRQMMVELTEKGRAVRRVASEEKKTWLAQAIAQLEKKDQETLFTASQIMLRLVEK